MIPDEVEDFAADQAAVRAVHAAVGNLVLRRFGGLSIEELAQTVEGEAFEQQRASITFTIHWPQFALLMMLHENDRSHVLLEIAPPPRGAPRGKPN